MGSNDVRQECIMRSLRVLTIVPDFALRHEEGMLTTQISRTMGDLRNKITSFSHKGYNQPYFLDTARLLHRIRRGEDLFERPKELYDRIDDNPDIPAYLQREDNRQKFAYMLDRDSPNGNFRDIR